MLMITVQESRRNRNFVETDGFVKMFKSEEDLDNYLEKRIKELESENFKEIVGGLKSLIRLENEKEIILISIM